jgi:hypothetical protein
VVTPPPADATNVFKSPFTGSGFGDSGTSTTDPAPSDRNYFSVGGSAPLGSTSPRQMEFSSSQRGFKMLWGSIDSYNSVAFSGGSIGAATAASTFTGTEIATLIKSIDPNINEAARNTDYAAVVDFLFGSETFDTITFVSQTGASSTGSEQIAAMEFATVIPVPFGALLIGTAFVAAGAVRRFSGKADV